jgi:hypothetical protein
VATAAVFTGAAGEANRSNELVPEEGVRTGFLDGLAFKLVRMLGTREFCVCVCAGCGFCEKLGGSGGGSLPAPLSSNRESPVLKMASGCCSFSVPMAWATCCWSSCDERGT